MQEELFYDDELHALRRMIEEGKGYKATSHFLWPDMKMESAYARLKDCVQRPEKGQFLKFGEIIAAMNFNGRFDPLYHAADQTEHKRPERRSPKDEALELQGRAERLLTELKQITERQERLVRAPIAVVK